MKELLLILLVIIMFSCDAQTIKVLSDELSKEKNYQVGLSEICDNNAGKTWYCVSKSEYDRLKALPQSCEIITITVISGNWFEGVINSDSFFYGQSGANCNL